MKQLYYFFSLLALVLKRLRHHAGLSLSSFIGILGILSLVVCVPVFASGVLSKVLEEQLTAKASKNYRSLFSLHAYYPDDPSYTNLTVAGAHEVANLIRRRLEDVMDLKVSSIEVQVTSSLFAWKPVTVQSTQPAFSVLYMGFISSDVLSDKIKLVDGAWPQVDDDPAVRSSQPIQVALLEDFADQHFLNVGDRYQADNLTVDVVGIFRAIDPADPAWFYNPETTFRDEMWVPMAFFENRLPTLVERPVHHTAWYTIVEDSSLRFSQSLSYTRLLLRLESDLQRSLPKASIDYSPLDMLKAYESRLKSMIALFYAAGAPMLVLALLFIWLTASIAVGQYEQETAVMGARGGNTRHFVILNITESLALIGLALPFALLCGWAGAGLMGQTQLFLQFTRRSGFTFSLYDVDPTWTALTVLAIVLARLLPLGGVKPSILSIKQERSRSVKKPLWERFYLDLMLFIPAYYAYLMMGERAKTIPTSAVEGQQTVYDPLMFLASSLFAIAVSMLALRIFPLILRLLGSAASRMRQVWIYLAVQEIARRPRDHASSLLLIMISLSFSIFSASMALTLEHWLSDAQYYRAGAELVVKEYEMPQDGGFAPGAASGQAGSSTAQSAPGSTRTVEAIVSLQSHLQQPDIQSATYVGKWPGRYSYGASLQECDVMGIDRLTFPSTAFFRSDFAAEPLGALMNALGNQPLGVLIPESLAQQSGLQPGDSLRMEAEIGVAGELVIGNMTVVGIYRYFPTVYPSERPTLITNLDALFGGPDAVTDIDVWLRLRPVCAQFATNCANAVLDGLQQMARRDFLLVDVRGNALAAIDQGMQQPEWVGLFGVLNVGFIVTGLLPGIGFVLYSFASLRRRSIQFGLLQALGLSTNQMGFGLVLEQVLLMSVALAGGAGVGVITCVMFLPFLQLGIAGASPTPPFDVLIGWRQAAWLCLAFGSIFVITLVMTLASLSRLKIFQALKLGEEV